MNPDEAQKLLAACAAFDNRQPSQIAKRAWATALKDVPLDQDAFDAVARFYGTPPKETGQRLWIQPHDVRTWRKVIRAERLENFTYDGDPDETPQQYLARLRRQIGATAAGEIPAAANAPALEGGPHWSVAKELEDVGQKVPPGEEAATAIRRAGPLGIVCPICQAAIGRPCKSALRNRASKVIHPARRRLAAGETAATESPEEIERRRVASLARLAQMAANEAESRGESA
ncbi:hypothetical protein ACFVSQ_13445 [Streptomyces niveus]|uniref:zinc finger domain-containing protein n=1 Tax=Streptomyces niveus TaxID=193462 RepID=UPI0036E22F9D